MESGPGKNHLGFSSLVLEDLETKRLINRHLVDIHPLRAAAKYPGHYQNSKDALEMTFSENQPMDIAFQKADDNTGILEETLRETANAECRKIFEKTNPLFNPDLVKKGPKPKNATPSEKRDQDSDSDFDQKLDLKLRRSKRLEEKNCKNQQ